MRIIKKLSRSTAIQITSSVWKSGSRDIRDVLEIAKLCNPSDCDEDRYISHLSHLQNRIAYLAEIYSFR